MYVLKHVRWAVAADRADLLGAGADGPDPTFGTVSSVLGRCYELLEARHGSGVANDAVCACAGPFLQRPFLRGRGFAGM